MADLETPPIESPSVETRALEMGWSPKDKWRGDPEKWVDATEYVRRGEEILPIVKHNNQQLLAKTGELSRELAAEKAERLALQKQLKDLADFQAEEVARQVKERTKDLRKQIREAREAGNADLEDELTDQLEEVRTTKKAAAEPPPPPPPDAPNPAYVAWAAENAEWWNKDKEKTHLAIGIAARLRTENPGFDGPDFYAAVDKRLDKFYQPPRAASKVEGGSGGSGGALSGNGRSFADLPADAKAQCQVDAKRFVGTKLFKDEKAWQAHYAQVYFQAQEPR